MSLEDRQVRQLICRDLNDVLIRVDIIVVLIWANVNVLLPFAGLMLQGLILAIILYPFHQVIVARLGHRRCGEAMRRMTCRFAGPEEGSRLHRPSAATVRQVSLGVVGVAFIQALQPGLGFMAADIPAAGVLALLVLVFGILQIPAAIIILIVIAYIWWAGASAALNIALTACPVQSGLADKAVKPLLLGSRVDAPMPIVLLGALGS